MAGRVDETYIKADCRRGNLPLTIRLVKGKNKYLDRAVDSDGNANPLYPPTDRKGTDVASPCVLDFLLTAKRDARAVRRFFLKTLKADHNQGLCCKKWEAKIIHGEKIFLPASDES